MKQPVYKTISITPSFQTLAKYITAYRQLRGRASVRIVTEQLLLAYAKQLASGMKEELWRNNIIALINQCEEEHQEIYNRELEKYRIIKEKEARIAAGIKQNNILRGVTTSGPTSS